MNKDNIFKKIGAAIIFIYLLFVLWGQYALIDTLFPPIPIALGMVFFAYIITKIAVRYIGKVTVKSEDTSPKKCEIKKLAIKIFAISFGIMLVCYYSRFPGIYFMDSVYQLNEVMTGNYDDWHPLLHTLLVYGLPMKIGGLWLIELLQIVFYCLALAYMICTLRWYGCPGKLCWGIFIYLMLQPDTTYIMLFPMKDCTFAILTMLLVTQYVHIVCTKGKWLGKNRNIALLIITTIVCTIIRHNAILFTLPLLCAVLYFACTERRRSFIYAIAVIAGILIIKLPFYGLFHMQPNEDRVTETMGLPIVMMGNVLTTTPELMDAEAVDFMYEVREQEIWEEFYKTGDWNVVKCYDGGADFDVIENAGRSKILGYMLDTLLRCPDESMKAFNSVTGMVWQIDGKMNWMYSMQRYDSNYKGGVYDNTDATDELEKYDIELPLADYIAESFKTYREVVDASVLKYVFSYVGILNLVMLITCFGKIKCARDLKRLFHILPIMAYSYGTALLLSAYDWRFFFYTYGCFFGVMYLLLRESDTEEECSIIAKGEE